jgi:hypothetical protein
VGAIDLSVQQGDGDLWIAAAQGEQNLSLKLGAN